MSTRGYLLFRRHWNGPLIPYYQHHDTYPTGLGADLIETMRTLEHMHGQISEEQIIEEMNKMGYNLRKAQIIMSKPEEAFEYQGDIEWVYVVDLSDAPSLEIWKTSNLYTEKDFTFQVWRSYLRYFPSPTENPALMRQLEISTNIALNALSTYEKTQMRSHPVIIKEKI